MGMALALSSTTNSVNSGEKLTFDVNDNVNWAGNVAEPHKLRRKKNQSNS